mgnify:CR=1 FL=1
MSTLRSGKDLLNSLFVIRARADSGRVGVLQELVRVVRGCSRLKWGEWCKVRDSRTDFSPSGVVLCRKF